MVNFLIHQHRIVSKLFFLSIFTRLFSLLMMWFLALIVGHVHVAEALGVPIHIFFTMPWT